MNLCYFVIALGFIQLVARAEAVSKPLETNAAAENFWNFYDNELSLMAQDFSEKAKTISEKLLQNEIIYKTSTSIEKSFKMFLNDFLLDYEHLKRYKLYQPIIRIFENVTNSEYYKRDDGESHEFDSKFKHLMKQHFGIILNEYEEKFIIFIEQKFLPQFEPLKQRLIPRDSWQSEKYLWYANDIKQCQDYICYQTNFELVTNRIHSPKAVMVKEFIKDFENVNVLVTIRTINAFKSMLKDQKLFELSPDVKQNITKLIDTFIKTFETNDDILKFVDSDLTLKFQYYLISFTPIEDYKLIADIYAKHNTAILKHKFALESRYYIYTTLWKYAFSGVHKRDIPKENLALMSLVKSELDSARKEDNNYYG